MKKLLFFLIIVVCISTNDVSAQTVNDSETQQSNDSFFRREQNYDPNQPFSPTPPNFDNEEENDTQDPNENNAEYGTDDDDNVGDEDNNDNGSSTGIVSLTPTPPSHAHESDATINRISNTSVNTNINTSIDAPLIGAIKNAPDYYQVSTLSKSQIIILSVIAITLFNIGLVLLFAENIVYGLLNIKQYVFTILTSSKFSHKLHVLRSIFY